MPAIAKRPATFMAPNGLHVCWAEALPYSLPSLNLRLTSGKVREVESTGQPPPGGGMLFRSPDVWCLGTRLAFLQTPENKTPVPIFVMAKSSDLQAAPWTVYPLHNTLDFTTVMDWATSTVHCFWWWNCWSPDYTTTYSPPTPAPPGEPQESDTQLTVAKLPRPPLTTYAPHSVPNLQAPVWLESLVPRYFVPEFDIRRPFWVAPCVEQWRYDYFVGSDDYLAIGESKANSGCRLADSPGIRYLQQATARGLLDAPPPASPFNQMPSEERFDWEARGGIVAAGHHIRLASTRDTPVFTPDSFPAEDLQSVPGLNTPFPSTTTIEDHLIIVQALKAHQDHKNVENATRVLMHATASLVSMELEVEPQYLIDPSQNWQSVPWPSISVPPRPINTLLLSHPKPVAAFPVTTNYRLVVNPTVVQYPEVGGAVTAFYSNQEGYVISTSTPNVSLEPAMDHVIHDPSPAWAKNANLYLQHLDVRSF